MKCYFSIDINFKNFIYKEEEFRIERFYAKEYLL